MTCTDCQDPITDPVTLPHCAALHTAFLDQKYPTELAKRVKILYIVLSCVAAMCHTWETWHVWNRASVKAKVSLYVVLICFHTATQLCGYCPGQGRRKHFQDGVRRWDVSSKTDGETPVFRKCSGFFHGSLTPKMAQRNENFPLILICFVVRSSIIGWTVESGVDIVQWSLYYVFIFSHLKTLDFVFHKLIKMKHYKL